MTITWLWHAWHVLYFYIEKGGSRTARPRCKAPRERASGTFEPQPGLKGARGAGGTPAYSTIPCIDEHLSIKVFKTRIYLICAIRNPFEAVSEKWQNTYQLSIGGVRKWVKRAYGLDISKSSVCSVRDKCGADKLEVAAAKIDPKLKSKKELAVLEAFKALGFITEKEEQGA